MGSATISFSGSDFDGLHDAEAFAAEVGFSIGSMQRDQPMGLLFGDFKIAKWSNLSATERQALHGKITGDKREGPVSVTIFDTAPKEAWDRWGRAVKARGQTVHA